MAKTGNVTGTGNGDKIASRSAQTNFAGGKGTYNANSTNKGGGGKVKREKPGNSTPGTSKGTYNEETVDNAGGKMGPEPAGPMVPFGKGMGTYNARVSKGGGGKVNRG